MISGSSLSAKGRKVERAIRSSTLHPKCKTQKFSRVLSPRTWVTSIVTLNPNLGFRVTILPDL